MYRKIAILALTICLILGMAGCGSDMTPQEVPQEVEAATAEAIAEASAAEALTAPPEQAAPAEAETETNREEALSCSISISCANILNNMDELTEGKEAVVPEDGWILKEKTVSFEEGDSVFDVLKRVCRDEGIHMEFSESPIYNSAYIEGINNIYEFDCGNLSGWMYSVNDWFPNYGCSSYGVKNGDAIRWQYTCNLGEDVK